MKEDRVETLDELAAHAVATADYPQTYTLDSREDKVYLDAGAGSAWETENHNLRMKYLEIARTTQETSGKPIYLYAIPGYEDEKKELDARLPAQRLAKFYWLKETGHTYYSVIIELSEELGEQVESIWTVKKTRWGSKKFVGMRTLKSICEKLGKTDFGAQIKAAQEKAKQEAARNRRNYRRAEIRDALSKLRKEIEKARDDGLFKDTDTEELKLGLIAIAIGEDETQSQGA